MYLCLNIYKRVLSNAKDFFSPLLVKFIQQYPLKNVRCIWIQVDLTSFYFWSHNKKRFKKIIWLIMKNQKFQKNFFLDFYLIW